MADRTVSVSLRAHVDQYTAAMQRVAKSTHDTAKSADKDLQFLGSRLQGIGTKMSLGLSLPLAFVAKQAVGFASAAHETTNKVAQAFGDNAKAIEEWSKDAARSMGQSQQEAENNAASFGTMFREMGLGGAQTLDMSKRIVQLAGDLGSFWDNDPTDMLERLRSGLVGEIEPLRRFGILLTDQAVRQEAVKLGLASSTTEVSEAAKVQARYALILDQTGTAQGDYARTADGAANSMRTAQAAYKDAMAELGDNLLPLVAKGAQTFADFAEAFGRMPEAGQSVLLGVGGFAALLGPAVFLTGGLIRNLHTIQELGPRAASALKWGGVAAGIAATAIAVGNLADTLFAVHTNAAGVATELANIARQGSGQLLPSYSDRTDDLELLIRDIKQFSDPSLGDKVAHTIEYLVPGKGPDRLHEASVRLGELDKGLMTLATSGSADAARAAVNGLMSALEEQGVSRDELLARLPQYAAYLEQQGIAEQFAGDKAGEANTELEQLGSTVDDLMSKTFGVQGATDQLAQDMLDLAKNVRDARAEGDQFATSLDSTSIEGLKNRSTLQGMAEDALRVAQAMADAGESPIQAMQQVRTQLIDTAVKLGFNRDQAAEFFNVLLQVGNLKVNPTIGLNTDPARQALQDLLNNAQKTMKSVFEAFGVDTSGWNTWAIPAQAPASLGPALTTGVGNVLSGASGGSGGSQAAETTPDEFAANKYRAGALSADDYKAYLQSRLSQTREFSNEYMQIWGEIQQVNQDIGAAWTAAQQQIEANQQRWMDVLRMQHEFGELSTADYLEQLRKRLAGLEKYSDEWASTMREIRALEDEVSQTEIEIIQAVEKQRQYDQGFIDAANARAMQAVREPSVVVQGGSTRSTTVHAPISVSDQNTAVQVNRSLRHLGYELN